VSLLGGEDEPRFLWREEARFKHLLNEDELELAGITSFGRAVAVALVAAAPAPEASAAELSAQELRDQVLASGRPYVDLLDLLTVCWTVGVPVVHLRVFPWPQKRMAAMTVSIQGRSAILLAKDAVHPPAIAFYLAHELGHLGLGHLDEDRIIVDLEDPDPAVARSEDDDEEIAADKFALELLTGHPEPTVVALGERPNATRLAAAALDASEKLHIEPGTLAQIFGHSTGDWRIATGALKVIYEQEKPVWQEVNALARQELQLDLLPDDTAEYLTTVMGETPDE
jgi:Zn-dependent peptidase ImmA (M78 family)